MITVNRWCLSSLCRFLQRDELHRGQQLLFVAVFTELPFQYPLAFSYFESLTEIGCELAWFYLFWIKPSAELGDSARRSRSSRGTPCAQLRAPGPHPLQPPGPAASSPPPRQRTCVFSGFRDAVLFSSLVLPRSFNNMAGLGGY